MTFQVTTTHFELNGYEIRYGEFTGRWNVILINGYDIRAFRTREDAVAYVEMKAAEQSFWQAAERSAAAIGEWQRMKP